MSMREAVSAIFICERDVFVIRRQDYLDAYPGYFAFPGGKVDEADERPGFSHPLLAGVPPRLANALIREIREELRFDLPQALEQDQVRAIDYFGEAITPPFAAIRYNAHFYRIELKRRPRFLPDAAEIAWGGWLDHQELYRHYTAGKALMVVPVMNAIRTLAADIHARGAGPFNLQYDAERELPYLEQIRGVGFIPVPSNTLPPAKATNALLLGDAPGKRFLVDPSPASSQIYFKLLRTLEHRRPDALFISHRHPDHHESAPRLARELEIPLYCSGHTRDELLDYYAPTGLDGVEIRTIEAGEVLTRWQGQPVRCHALPGHDAGMLGLAPDDMAWFFVADLVQAGASVVIPEKGGDMGDYFGSLRQLCSQGPRALIPSHGFPTGGTHLARKTLEHRLQREEQIRHGLEDGLGVDELVLQLYPGIEPRLKGLAEQNIRQHMRKLEREGAV